MMLKTLKPRVGLPLVAALAGIAAALLPPLVIGAGLLLMIGIALPAVLFMITLTVAPLKTLIETEAGFSLDPGQISFGLLVAVYAAHRIAQRRPLLPRSVHIAPGVVWALVVILLGAGASLFVAESPGQTVNELIKWLEIGIMAIVVAGLCESHDRSHTFARRLIVIGILAAACIQAAVGLYQFLGGSGAAHLWVLDNRFFRAFGTYGQPNPFGAHMELALALAVGVLFGALSSRHTPAILLSLIPCAILGAGLIASWSRGAWLGFGAGLVVMILYAPRRRWLGAALVFGGVGVFIAAAALGLLPGSIVARLSDFSQELTAVQDVRGQVINDERYAVLERLAHWQAAIGMADDHPLLGVGFGNYEVAYPRYALMNWKYPLGHAHNYYLNTLAETGIVGLITYIIGWLAIVYLTLRSLPAFSGLNRGVVLGLLGVWAALAVHSVFDKLYVNNLFLHIGAMFGLIIALRAAMAQREPNDSI